MKINRYIHDFPSCSRTYATLCVYHPSADPDEVTSILKLKPDRITKVGDYISRGKNAKVSGWFLSTESISDSKDLRAHLELLLSKLNRKKKSIHELSQSGYSSRFLIFWESAHGNGGPIIDYELIKKLSEYEIDLHFDIWFANS